MFDPGAIASAREDFVRTGRVPPPEIVRPIIAHSWARSMASGLRPDRIRPVVDGTRPRPGTLARTIGVYADSRGGEQVQALLRTMPAAVTITDHLGLVVGHWAHDSRLVEQLDAMGMAIGIRLTEQAIGTTGGSLALRTGQTVTVHGPEHFSIATDAGTATTALIRDPRTGHRVGTISLSSRISGASPLAVPWVEEQARVIEGLLHERLAHTRALFDVYLEHTRYRSSNVVCIGDDSVVLSAAAAKSLPAAGLPALVERASRLAAEGGSEVFGLRGEGTTGDLVVKSEPVREDGAVIGVVMRVVGSRPRSHREQPHGRISAPLARLSGASERWRVFTSAVEDALRSDADILVTAPPGAGRSAVAAEIARALRGTVVAGSLARVSTGDWADAVTAAAGGGRAVVIDDLQHVVDPFGSQTLEVLRALLGPARPRIIATIAADGAGHRADGPAELSGWAARRIALPGLDERPDDIPALLAAITRATGAAPAGWSPEAVRAVQRAELPLNVKSLERIVVSAVRSRRGDVILLRDLEPDVQARRDARTLRGIEAAEVAAIVAALTEARGTRTVAAQLLGISRTTLFRKIRTYGLDVPERGFRD
jgi:sigma-54 dependent transcriptional regulator, acetoin dehydrogenase operon transcriptional activator AcoR